jgi:KRAB domain-containing zinc finger protein
MCVCKLEFRLNILPHISHLYGCDICGRRFSQNACLQYHIRTHTGDKPYKCHICDKGFSSNRYLQNHIRTHTGDKPYKCHICG